MARPVSNETLVIRELLKEHKGELTWSEVEPLLQAKNVTVTDTYFYSVKQAWKKAQDEQPAAAKVRKARILKLPEVSPAEAVQFVMENGGLTKVQEDIKRRLAMVKVFKAVLRQAAA